MRSGPAHPLVPLGLREVGGESQLGHEAEGLPHGEVREEPVVLANVSDALLHQLRRVGLPVDQDVTAGHSAALVPTSYDVQQGGLPTALGVCKIRHS